MIVLYSLAIFLGAALLFTAQPLFTRLLLPLLGGAPSVWNTAQVFFQVALLAGYGYAHLTTTRLGIRRQARLHLGVLLLPLLALPWSLARASAPPERASPVPWLLLTMVITVGPPFFVASATGPLLQRWFSATGHPRAADPYFLYAASNLGSMLALLAYPTLLEPNLRLATQTSLWAWLYGALIVLMAAAALFIRSAPVATPAPSTSEGDAPGEGRLAAPTWPRILRWVSLAFVPSSLMLGTTTYWTTDIASAPLLWVIPLSIYLLTFILAFLEKPLLPHRHLVFVAPLLITAGVVAAAIPLGRPVWLVLGLSLAVLFVLAMVCHGELARDRPASAHLTGFFFWISVGGALGGTFCALLAPILFRSVVEYGVTLVAAAFLLPLRPERDGRPRLRDLRVAAFVGAVCVAAILARRAGLIAGSVASALGIGVPALLALGASSRPIRLGLSFAALLAVGHENQLRTAGVLFQDRSFFGALKVAETEAWVAGLIGVPDIGAGGKLRSLYHGATLHGVQNPAPTQRAVPLSYYAREGPIGQVFLSGAIRKDARIAVVGLGVGSLLAYAEPEQRWTLYEIDPAVAAIARDARYFTYLADAKAPYSIVLGDARRSLSSSSSRERFSLIVLDAYSSDAVPIHLLTREAVEAYLGRLSEGGIIAAHISNHHLDLTPVVAGISEALGLVCLEQQSAVNQPAMAQGKMPSHWVILARRREDLGALGEDPRWSAVGPGQRVIWTDDYSSLVTVWLGR